MKAHLGHIINNGTMQPRTDIGTAPRQAEVDNTYNKS